ncbi:MAG: M15 family metallopeptidase [Planctomycetes bacterium]|nr:M15 family metallopeptidase [Planctomycetota bacterium]
MNSYSFGKRSRANLAEIRPGLRAVPILALSWGIIDFSIYEAKRPKAEQNLYYRQGKSRVEWPNGKHNVLNPDDLVNAFDAAPFINGKISWKQVHCVALSGIMIAAGRVLGVQIRWGGDWNSNGEPITDQNFQDLVHYERSTRGGK